MSFGFGSKGRFPIGLDLGSSVAKLAQLRDDQAGLELSGYGQIEIPRHIRRDAIGRLDFFSQKIPRLLKHAGFHGRKCILGLPPESTFIRHVRIPALDEKGTTSAVARAVQKELNYPVSEAVVRHIVAGEVYSDGETRQEVIVVAAPRSTMDAYLAMTDRVGLEIVAVTVEPLALLDCFSELFRWGAEGDDRTILYLDLGAQNTQVVIAHGKNVVFIRNMPHGGEEIETIFAEKMGASVDEARQLRRDVAAGRESNVDIDHLYGLLTEWLGRMSEEFETCLRYYNSVFRRRGVDRVVFTGGQAHDRRLCQALARRLNLPAQIGDPLAALSVSDALRREGITEARPELSVAIGLSLGGRDQ